MEIQKIISSFNPFAARDDYVPLVIIPVMCAHE